jgi:hypothetical protein
VPSEAVVTPIESSVAAAMRGARVAGADAGVVLDAAIDHGVAALLHERAIEDWPCDVRERLRGVRREQLVASIARTRQACRAFDALSAAGIRAAVIKGAHVQHTIYRDAADRPCSDTDVLIRAADRDRASAVLERIGYRRPVHIHGRVILGQFHFELPAPCSDPNPGGRGAQFCSDPDPGGRGAQFCSDPGIPPAGAHLGSEQNRAGYPLDVHWRIAAPLVFETAVDVDAVLARAVPLPPVGPGAVAPASADAMVIACVHLIAHHACWPRLVWLYDLHLLAAAADPPIADGALLDASRGVRAICARALRTAAVPFPHPRLDACAALLERHAGAEPSASLLRRRHPLLDLWRDVRTDAPWSMRWTLLKEHLCPGADYMRRAGYRAPLPLAYAARAAAGVRRLIAADR